MTKHFKDRKFLFLQGPNSFFFRELGRKLKSCESEIKKINLCGGDLFFWNDDDSIRYSGDFDGWQNYLKELEKEFSFTDIILYGDCREYHKTAIELYSKTKKIHVFEEGYFRPFWVTYELNGVNFNSSMPSNPHFYKGLDDIYDQDEHIYKELKPSFRHKAFYTCLHYIYRSFFDHKYFPKYLPHRKISPEKEGAAWFRKGMKHYFRKAKSSLIQSKILKRAEKQEFFLLALQLCTDSQIVEHSTLSGMRETIDIVLQDFAKNCPEEYFIVVKTHPEEPGISKLAHKVEEAKNRLNIANRVIFIDGGNMPKFLHSMRGMVTINSTATLSALHHEKPVKCLGDAFYNFEGLTCQNELSEFWKNPYNPDNELFLKFKKYVNENSQINGNFYSPEGINVLIENLLPKL